MGFLNEILVSFERIEADSGSCSSISDRKVKLIFYTSRKERKQKGLNPDRRIYQSLLEVPEIRVPEHLLYGTGGSNSIPVPSMQTIFD